jgi:rhodanese-related sulfurtransferase
MHSLRSKWFAVLLAYIFMFAAYGHSPAAELPQTGALAPAEALQLMDTLGDKLTVIDVRTVVAGGHKGRRADPHVDLLRPGFPQQVDGPAAGGAPDDGVVDQHHPADGSVLLLCRTGRRAETAYDMIREAYAQKKNLWFLKGIPVYGNDGSFTFK